MTEMFHKVHILVVELNDNIRDILVDIFTRRGFVVLEAKHWRDAVRKAGREKPDIIMIDVVSPELDGIEICRNLREDALTRDIPIIFYSSYPSIMNDFVRNMPNAPIEYFEKAYEVTHLVKEINKLIARI